MHTAPVSNGNEKGESSKLKRVYDKDSHIKVL